MEARRRELKANILNTKSSPFIFLNVSVNSIFLLAPLDDILSGLSSFGVTPVVLVPIKSETNPEVAVPSSILNPAD